MALRMTSSLRMHAVSAGLACLPLARKRKWKLLMAGLLRIPATVATYWLARRRDRNRLIKKQ